MKTQNLQQTAQSRTKAKVEFKIHLINYIVINAILAVINLTLTPGYLWFKWPLLGWGIGIVLHRINIQFLRISSLKE
ncbi:2TM domain-containing protein [Sunxiuqinia sp. A32]|uniref:2TM domain-containing protein n=1 Tax=Sunxiuqinia sp. A32 TaxID=3461496 RepID=UPI00404613DA